MWLGALLVSACGPPRATPEADGSPATGPLVVAVDAGHRNVNTLGGRYRPFGELLEADGLVVRALSEPLSAAALAEIDVLVVSNARPREALGAHLARGRSAFEREEIEALVDWVDGGGALLFVADHMPAAGYAASLAEAFGVEYVDGFAMEAGGPRGDRGTWSLLVFDRERRGLADHPITRGRNEHERVESVVTFSGCALRSEDPAAVVLLRLPPDAVALMPAKPWEFADDTPRRDVGGWSQGLVLERGAGRVAFFGEASMFTDVEDGSGGRLGFGHPEAAHNRRFVLNLVRWLARTLRDA